MSHTLDLDKLTAPKKCPQKRWKRLMPLGKASSSSGGQTGVVLYDGESRFDGSRILAILTFHSSNWKTGDIPQVWILRADRHPREVRAGKLDQAICGHCPLAANMGCYVTSPELGSIWRKLQAGGYMTDVPRAMRRLVAEEPPAIRLGAYGDPAAVPIEVWDEMRAALPPQVRLIAYTHAWDHMEGEGYKHLCMASVDSPAQAARARAKGWRTFRVALPQDEEPVKGQEVCPFIFDPEGVKCRRCRICTGAGGKGPCIVVPAHGGAIQKTRALDCLRRAKGLG
jgi:hypothetical protein